MTLSLSASAPRATASALRRRLFFTQQSTKARGVAVPRIRARKATFAARTSEMADLDEATRARRQSEKQAAKDAGLVKRKVALHVGYVGTNYCGLQLSTEDHVQTIERVLQKALCQSGCVTESNSVSLSKVKWSRSSRTDKGVHSLATVIALKCLVDEQKFDTDPEGLELARRISSFLPPDVQVFAVQRVNDGFFARKACMSRTYCYYVPLWLITGSTESAAEGEEVQESVELFRKALNMFCGRHAFHNYTKRKQYIDNPDTWRAAKRNRANRRKDKTEEDNSDSGEDNPEPQSRPSYADYEELVAREKETGRWRFWNVEYKELGEDSDRVVQQHYRNIESFVVDDPAPVIPGGVVAACCRVHGQSFMLHQIRHMIGTAIAVARKLISLSVLESSLKACIRINLPLAPPQPLVLADNEFAEFPSNKGEPAAVAKWSGSRLELKEGGKELRDAFLTNAMLPEINQLLQLPEWENWSEVLKLIQYDEEMHEDVKDVVEKCNEWVAEKRQIKEAKREALEKELEEKGIDRETWMKERQQKSKRGARK